MYKYIYINKYIYIYISVYTPLHIVNFQVSMTVLNACTKNVWKLIECTMNFAQYWFSCAESFGAVHLLSCKLVTLMKLFSAFVAAFGLPAQLLVPFFPLS